MFTGGQMAARIAPLPGAEKVFRRGIVARDLGELGDALGVATHAAARSTRETAEAVAEARAAAQPAPATRWPC